MYNTKLASEPPGVLEILTSFSQNCQVKSFLSSYYTRYLDR